MDLPFNFYIEIVFNDVARLAKGVTGADQVENLGNAIRIARRIFQGKLHADEHGMIRPDFIDSPTGPVLLTYEVEFWGVSIGFMEALQLALLQNGGESLDESQLLHVADLDSKRVRLKKGDQYSDFKVRYDSSERCLALVRET